MWSPSGKTSLEAAGLTAAAALLACTLATTADAQQKTQERTEQSPALTETVAPVSQGSLHPLIGEMPNYTVQSGDTLSLIARVHLGNEGVWSSIWAENRSVISDPNLIYPGQSLHMPSGAEQVSNVVSVVQTPSKPKVTPKATPVAPKATPRKVTPNPGYTGGGNLSGIERCESGGNPRAQNPYSSASGLYQMLDSTWKAYGGSTARAKDASVAEQNAVAQRLYAAEGTRPWAASQHCWG